MQSPVYCVCTSQGLDMFFVFFDFLFPHPLSASKREKKTAKSLDDTPESDQEVGSDRREMPPPFWKSSFFSQSRRQQIQAAPPLETLLSRDRRYTAGCIPYRAAVLIRARNINEDEETFAFQNDIGFRPSLPSQLLTRRHCGLCVAPRWMVLHQHFVRRRVPSSTRRLFAQSFYYSFSASIFLFSAARSSELPLVLTPWTNLTLQRRRCQRKKQRVEAKSGIRMTVVAISVGQVDFLDYKHRPLSHDYTHQSSDDR